MSGVELEDMIAEGFEKQGYIVFTRRNHCDVLAVKPDMALAYLVECKDYELSRKQQSMAVRELNRNYTYALELLKDHRLYPEKSSASSSHKPSHTNHEASSNTLQQILGTH